MTSPDMFLNQNIAPPSFSWRPDKFWRWWMTPRSQDRDTAFRERTMRLLTFVFTILGVIGVVARVQELVTLDVITTQKTMVVIVTITQAALWFVTGFFLLRGRYNAAGIAVILGFSVGWMNSIFENGFESATTSIFIFINFLLGFIILPRKWYWPYIIANLLLIAGLIEVADRVGTYATGIDIIDIKNVQHIFYAIMLTTIGMLMYYLLREFYLRQEALNDLVQTLEQRVSERTAELEKAKEAAEEANRVKSQFLANMSHELRTPLNAILNFTAFVADGVMGPVNDEQADMLHQSIASGKHLLALINDILDITKIEAGMMDLFIQEVDMNDVLKAIESMGVGLVKDKAITLETHIAHDLPTTYGDKRRLRQVFLNIMSNAVKFTPEGSVTLRAHTINDGQHMRVEITDTGIGIAPEDQALIFESFKQAKHDLHEAIGTGLGMPISKYFVQMHGGRIWLESEVGVGTTFYVELPVLREDEANQLAQQITEPTLLAS